MNTRLCLRPVASVAGLLLILLLGGVVAALTGPGVAAPALAGPAAGAAAPTPAGQVLVVSLPRVTWGMIDEHRPPGLLRFFEQSAVASTSPRTIGRRTTLGQAYATIGAGNRAQAFELVSGLAFDIGERVADERAVDVYARRTGIDPGGAVVHLGLAHIQASNERLRFGAEVGALAEALRARGRSTAVIGNADTLASPTLAVGAQREAALAMMDANGQVAGGTVSAGLLAHDSRAPHGLRLDEESVRAALDTALAEHDVVLLEISDFERLDRYAVLLGPDARRRARAEAFAQTDRLLAHALAQVDLSEDLVIVVGPSHPRARVELTVGAIAGPGIEPGLARSGSTRRAGYITLPDLAPTILAAFGIEVPTQMSGAPIASAGGPAPEPELFAAFADDNELAVFRNRVTGSISVTFIVLQVLAYAMAVAALVTGRRRLRPVVEVLALTVLAVPAVAFLSGLVRFHVLGAAGYFAVLFAAALTMALVALGIERWASRRSGRTATPAMLVAPLSLIGLTLVVLLVDIAVGGPLQINTVFGYGGGPIVAGRFAGFGNLAWSLAAVSALLVATGGWAVARGGRSGPMRTPRRVHLAAIVGLFVVTVLAIGLPQLGLNVGGVLATVPAFLVTGMLLAGVKLSWRRLVLVAAAPIVLLGLFALLDLSREPDARTHLGRFVALAADQGGGGVATVIARKLNANLSILTSSIWTIVVPIALAFLAFLAWRQPRSLRTLAERLPGVRPGVIGALVLCVLGGVLNDSGVAIPAIILTVLLPYLAVLAVRTDARLAEPEPRARPAP